MSTGTEFHSRGWEQEPAIFCRKHTDTSLLMHWSKEVCLYISEEKKTHFKFMQSSLSARCVLDTFTGSRRATPQDHKWPQPAHCLPPSHQILTHKKQSGEFILAVTSCDTFPIRLENDTKFCSQKTAAVSPPSPLQSHGALPGRRGGSVAGHTHTF